mmetsp:Transcript_43795/g.103090  ORF Transcript_43795/g.103090 Transcript_43795/m.103090 type:complete len:197 (+) Transcript_43795:235-825(+)
MACPQQARLVVVGADEEEQTFAFESLVENDDGDYMSSRVQFVNNDIFTDCVLTKGFKELRIYCGDMTWILPAETDRLYDGGRYWARQEEGTTATANVEIEQFEGEGAGPDDLAVSTLVIDTSPPATFLDDVPGPIWQNANGAKQSGSLGLISYKRNGKLHTATCMPYGRVKAESGQVFERLDNWLQSVQHAPHDDV